MFTTTSSDREERYDDNTESSSFSSFPSSVHSMALNLIAASHHRESQLFHAIRRWQEQFEASQRRRKRKEMIAESFFGHKLQFVAFRAWQWSFGERRRDSEREVAAQRFQSLWDQKRTWLAWRRVVQQRKASRSCVASLEKRFFQRLLLGCFVGASEGNARDATTTGICRTVSDTVIASSLTHRCRLHQLPPTSEGVRSYSSLGYLVRWAVWASHRRITRNIEFQTWRRAVLNVINKWLRVLFSRRRCRIIRLESEQRSSMERRCVSLHRWLSWTLLRRRLPHLATAFCGAQMLQQKATHSLSLRCFRRLKVVGQVRVQRLGSEKAVRHHRYWLWVRFVIARRFERHIEFVADRHCLRRAVRMVGHACLLRARRGRDDRLATAFRDERQSRTPWVVFQQWWQRALERSKRRFEQQEALELRRAMLVVVASRRLLEHSHSRTKESIGRPHRSTSAGHDVVDEGDEHDRYIRKKDSVSVSPATRGGGGVTSAAATVPSPGIDFLNRCRTSPPIPLLRSQQHSSSPRSTAAAVCYPMASEAHCHTQRWDAAPASTAGTVSLRAMSIPAVLEERVRILLERYRAVSSTALDDANAFDRLRQNAIALHHLTPNSHTTTGEEGEERRHVEDQMRYLRDKIETRQNIRAQLVLAQRQLQHAVAETAGGGATEDHFVERKRSGSNPHHGDDVLLFVASHVTPRSDVSNY